MSRSIINLTKSCFAAAFATLILSNYGWAQSEYDYDDSMPEMTYQPTSPYPVEMGFTYDHASTVEEGARRGRAAEIQAWGNYQVQLSQADILREQARWINRENDLKQTQALYAQQDMWRERRVQEREEREARKQEGLKKVAQRKSSVLYAAYQLTGYELDLRTGRISWPTILEDARYDQSRERLEELFRELVQYGEPQAATANQIVRCTNQLKKLLEQEIGDLPRDEYFAAQTFILGLKYEAERLVEAV